MIKWCKHVDYSGGNGYSFLLDEHQISGYYYVPLHFTHCPYCGKPKPKIDDESILEDIFDRHGIKSMIGSEPDGPDSSRLLREELLEWKRKES